jgi:hypothetical protein
MRLFCLIMALSTGLHAGFKDDIREHIVLSKLYSQDNQMNAKGGSDFYFFVGKSCAYDELLDYIDEYDMK